MTLTFYIILHNKDGNGDNNNNNDNIDNNDRNVTRRTVEIANLQINEYVTYITETYSEIFSSYFLLITNGLIDI